MFPNIDVLFKCSAAYLERLKLTHSRKFQKGNKYNCQVGPNYKYREETHLH